MKKILLILAVIAAIAGCRNANSNNGQADTGKRGKVIAKERIYMYEGIDHIGEIVPNLEEEYGAIVNEYDEEGRLLVRNTYTVDEGESSLDEKLTITYDKNKIVRREYVIVWGYKDNDTLTSFIEDGKWKVRNIKGEVIDAPEGYDPNATDLISVDKDGKCNMGQMAKGEITKYDNAGRWSEAIMTGAFDGDDEEFIFVVKREILAMHP